MQKLGVDAAATAAKRMGITTIHNPESYGLTLALGTAEVQLYQLTNVYAAFAHGGEQFPPTLITSIKDKYGNTVYSNGFTKSHRVQSEQASFLISSILSDNAARAPSYGSSLNIPGHQAAVKTGTTNDNKDAWTFGYTPSIAIGVWVGNNENEPMHGIAGGSSAGKIWRDSMIAFLKDLPTEKFTPPPGVSEVRLCRGTELRAPSGYSNSFNEYFINGTAPTGECRVQRITTPKKEDKKPPEQKQDDKGQNNGNGDDKPGGRGGDGGNDDTINPPTGGDPGTGDPTDPSPTDPDPPDPTPEPPPPPPT
jgi:penicillin-binding protein 1A